MKLLYWLFRKLSFVCLWVNCLFRCHDYTVLRKINSNTRELICRRCGKKFGINDRTQVVLPLDQDLIDAHEMMLGGH